MRAPLALAVLALWAAGLPAPAAAHAAVVCQGKPATIQVEVPEEGAVVSGTESADVIVVTKGGDGSGLFDVDAGGGDDTVCIVGWIPPDGGPEADSPDVWGGEGHDSLHVIGSPEKDVLAVHDVEDLDVRLRGSSDKLSLSGAYGLGSIAFGRQGGWLRVSDERRVRADLEAEILSVGRQAGRYDLVGAWRVLAVAPRVALVGDRHANGLEGVGCRVTLRGGPGRDVLQARMLRPRQCSSGARLVGQGGDDRLVGTPLDDVLLGGPGRDKAFGRQGNDTCVAEVRIGCER